MQSEKDTNGPSISTGNQTSQRKKMEEECRDLQVTRRSTSKRNLTKRVHPSQTNIRKVTFSHNLVHDLHEVIFIYFLVLASSGAIKSSTPTPAIKSGSVAGADPRVRPAGPSTARWFSVSPLRRIS